MPGPMLAFEQSSLVDREHGARPTDIDWAAAEAWTIFWQDQALESRCCANAPADIRQALDSHWRAFASALPAGTRVVDIGSGTGAVGRHLIACRPGLTITGVDFAAVPPSTDPRIALLPGTPMEFLPFARASFGAVVSQFGYEYGRSGEAAREIARVLLPGAPLSLLVHHADSPIVAGNRSHGKALDRLIGALLRTTFMAGDSAALGRALAAIRRDCPGERIVDQAAQCLALRVRGSKDERRAVWTAIVDALAPERIMAKSLEASCVSPAGLARWLEPLAEWFALEPPSIMRMGRDQPLAWKIEGRRR